jgi:hypothetical protein
MFLHADNDGFRLDANHDQPIEADDLPGLIAAFNNRKELYADWQDRDAVAPWTEKWWFGAADAIEREDWNLSASLPPGKPRSRRAPRPARIARRTARPNRRDPGRHRRSRRGAWGAGGVSDATTTLGDVCRMARRTLPTVEAMRAGLKFVGIEHVDPDSGRITPGNGSRVGDGKAQSFLFDDRHVLSGKLRPHLRKIALPEGNGCFTIGVHLTWRGKSIAPRLGISDSLVNAEANRPCSTPG